MRIWTVVLIVVAVLGAGGTLWMLHSPGEQMCQACQRPVHQHSLTLGEVDGKPMRFCCPMCALTEHKQSGKKVMVKQLTDFVTGEDLTPGSAFLVRGSGVNPCSDSKAHLSHDKQPLHVHFDRCSPSVLAFSSHAAAAAHAQKHGGQVLRFTQVEPLYR
jgi:hypothetical protein